MKKKIVSMFIMVIMMVSLSVNAFAECNCENDKSKIVGSDIPNLVEKIVSVSEAIDNDEINYMIEMLHHDGLWFVELSSMNSEDELAVGIYEHMPTEKELDELWENNRMTKDEMMNEMDKIYEVND